MKCDSKWKSSRSVINWICRRPKTCQYYLLFFSIFLRHFINGSLTHENDCCQFNCQYIELPTIYELFMFLFFIPFSYRTCTLPKYSTSTVSFCMVFQWSSLLCCCCVALLLFRCSRWRKKKHWHLSMFRSMECIQSLNRSSANSHSTNAIYRTRHSTSITC